MKKLYYFSRNKLKFIEITNFHRKFVFLVIFFSIVSAFFVFGGYFLLDEYVNPDSEIKSLQAQNRELRRIYTTLSKEYTSLDKEINELFGRNNKLRNSARLEPLKGSAHDLELKGMEIKYYVPKTVDDFTDLISSYTGVVDDIAQKLKNEVSKYDSLIAKFNEREEYFNAIPSLQPCTGEYGEKFGNRLDPILGIERLHPGIDIITPVGTEIIAPADGKIIFTGKRPGMGETIEIQHAHGYKTVYCHLSKIETRLNKTVKRGDKIALSGSTGKLTRGPSLHYEVLHNDIPLDPMNFIFDDLKLFDGNDQLKDKKE